MQGQPGMSEKAGVTFYAYHPSTASMVAVANHGREMTGLVLHRPRHQSFHTVVVEKVTTALRPRQDYCLLITAAPRTSSSYANGDTFVFTDMRSSDSMSSFSTDWSQS